MYKIVITWKRDTTKQKWHGRAECLDVVLEEHEDREKAVNAMNVFVLAWEKRDERPFRICVMDEKNNEITNYELGGIV